MSVNNIGFPRWFSAYKGADTVLNDTYFSGSGTGIGGILQSSGMMEHDAEQQRNKDGPGRIRTGA